VRKWPALIVAAAVVYGAGQHELAAPPAVPAAASANEALAGKMAASGYGWTGAQATCLDDLWSEESGFSAAALNHQTGATGIPQLNPSAHAIPSGWSSPATQIRWGLEYIKDTYGSPCAAWEHEKSESPHWY
jgi:hypothetical protein